MRPALGSIVLGGALLLVAALFDAESLYVTGTGLLLLGVIAIVWVLACARGATVSRTVSARRAMEGEPVAVRLVVTPGRWPLTPARLADDLLAEAIRVPAGRRGHRLRLDVRFARRGRRVLPPPVLRLRDPLGLVERRVVGEVEHEVLILPRIEPVRVDAGGGDGRPAHALGGLAAAAENELDGLRPHREGTPASRIHWPSFARGAGLMERNLRADADQRPLVVLDPRGAPTPGDLDAAVRATASLAHHLARRGGCSLLLPGDRRAIVVERDLAAWPAAHARLALMESVAGPSLAGVQGRQGLILLVSPRTLDRPPAALARSAAGCVLVAPGEGLRGSVVLSVAGCVGRMAGRAMTSAAREAIGS